MYGFIPNNVFLISLSIITTLISSSLLRLFNLGTYLLMEMTARSYPALCRVAYKSPLPFLSAFPHPISNDYLYLSMPWSFLLSSNQSLYGRMKSSCPQSISIGILILETNEFPRARIWLNSSDSFLSTS